MRLFEARTYGNAKVVLKEFLPRGLKLAYREIEVGWGVEDVRRALRFPRMRTASPPACTTAVSDSSLTILCLGVQRRTLER